MSKFLILSVKHSTKDEGAMLKWWGPDNRGYVERLAKAGRYSLEEAEAIVTVVSGQRQSSVMISEDHDLAGALQLVDSTRRLEALDALEIWEAYHG